MIIRNVTLAQFTSIVEGVGQDAYNGNLIIHPDMRQEGKRVIRVQGRIRAESSREAGARRSWSGRRTVAACWHAHRDVYRALFAQYPDATVQTSMARYDAATFEDVYPATGNVNIGSMFAPAYMPELCDC